MGGIVEELALGRGRQVGHQTLEAADDGVVAAAQTVDGKVAGEHGAFRAEDGDGLANDPGVVFGAPRLAGEAQAGDLQRHVGPFGEAGQGRAPGGQTFGAAVGRQPRVVEDQLGGREVPRQATGFVEIPPGRLQVEVQAVVLVAGGTGLSAFLGMLDEMAEKGGCGQPVRLFYGVTQEQDLCEGARLEAYRASIADFDYQPVVSQPSPAWQGLSGYIPEHFDRRFLTDQACDLYLCGPPPMVEAVKTWLDQQGLGEETRLYSEKFLQSASSR